MHDRGGLSRERAGTLNANRKELEGLLEARKGMEARYVEEKLAREEAYTRELLDMQTADAENFHKLKVKLETDVAILEQQLENMKFTYLLNSEKLEYNYRVLTERDAENKSTLAAQKQRLARLRTALLKVRGDFVGVEATYIQRNAALTGDFTKLTKAYRDLQSKYRSFEAVDASRYADLVGMHHEEVTALVNRVLNADRVITEQLLGRMWLPPDRVIPEGFKAKPAKGGNDLNTGRSLVIEEGASLSDMEGLLDGVTPAVRLMLRAASVGNSSVEGGDDEGSQAGAVDDAPGAGGFERRVSTSTQAAVTAFLGGGGVGGPAAPGDDLPAGITPTKVRALLHLLVANAASFLLDPPLREACARLEMTGKQDVADALRADGVLQVLGATSPDDVMSLAVHFEGAIQDAVVGLASAHDALMEQRHGATSRPGSAETSSTARTLSTEGALAGAAPDLRYGLDVPDALNPDLPRVPPHVSVLALLREWVTTRQDEAERREAEGSTAAGVVAALDEALGGKDKGLEAGSQTSMKSKKGDNLRYWRELGATLPDSRYRVWDALETALVSHRDTLTRRVELTHECDELQTSNLRLRELLDSYLSSPSVATMEVPPLLGQR